MVLIPQILALALQMDGWIVRSEIVWGKLNPMPESVTDRPTKAHEQIWMLTRSPRYFFDQEAVRQPPSRDWWNDTGRAERHATQALAKGANGDRNDGGAGPVSYNPAGRNIRSVWEIATQPYPEAHFATFPEALPERCIRAGTSERGCCPECGAPWERETGRAESIPKELHDKKTTTLVGDSVNDMRTHNVGGGRYQKWLDENPLQTTGWQATCQCGSTHVSRSAPFPHPVPCTVLDPFMGSGTVALVARRLGRKSIGVELNPEYAALCARRLQQLSLFAGADA
jgi:hypothetical protein